MRPPTKNHLLNNLLAQEPSFACSSQMEQVNWLQEIPWMELREFPRNGLQEIPRTWFLGIGNEKFPGKAVDIFTGFSCERFLGISADFPQNCYLGRVDLAV